MLLCEKFQARFGRPQASPALILLNEAAIELAVPRRRLYDIINVLEAVEVCTPPEPFCFGIACTPDSSSCPARTPTALASDNSLLTRFVCCRQIVTRTGKLAYEWKGLKHLPQLLDRLVADQVRGTAIISNTITRTTLHPLIETSPQHGLGSFGGCKLPVN